MGAINILKKVILVVLASVLIFLIVFFGNQLWGNMNRVDLKTYELNEKEKKLISSFLSDDESLHLYEINLPKGSYSIETSVIVSTNGEENESNQQTYEFDVNGFYQKELITYSKIEKPSLDGESKRFRIWKASIGDSTLESEPVEMKVETNYSYETFIGNFEDVPLNKVIPVGIIVESEGDKEIENISLPETQEEYEKLAKKYSVVHWVTMKISTKE